MYKRQREYSLGAFLQSAHAIHGQDAKILNAASPQLVGDLHPGTVSYTHLDVYKRQIIGDDQSIQYNLSTFSSYVTHLSDILKNVNSDDLVLLDELGSGTDPIEGASLAQSITEFLNDRDVYKRQFMLF